MIKYTHPKYNISLFGHFQMNRIKSKFLFPWILPLGTLWNSYACEDHFKFKSFGFLSYMRPIFITLTIEFQLITKYRKRNSFRWKIISSNKSLLSAILARAFIVSTTIFWRLLKNINVYFCKLFNFISYALKI